jgi:hypothetical protein
MKIEKKVDWIAPKEKLVGLEISNYKNLLFYSFTYLVERGGKFQPLVRWDNFNKRPHVDIYEGENLTSYDTEEKTHIEVLKLVKMFRQNLPRMNLESL